MKNTNSKLIEKAGNKKKILTVCAVAAVILLIISCFIYNRIMYGPIKPKEPVSLSEVSILDFSDAYLIGHRGFSAIAPENTLASFEEACKAGFYGCEFDIHLTLDNEWVVMHDSNMKKMTGKRGIIEKLPAQQVKGKAVVNGANYEKYYNSYIPTLEETLNLLSRYDIMPVIEIKTDTTQKLREVLNLLKKYDLFEKTWIISFEKAPLIELRKISEKIQLSYLVKKVDSEAIDFCLEYRINGIDFKKDNAGSREVEMIVNAGLTPQVWTVDTIEEFKKFYFYGVRYFTGNCLTY